MTARRLQHQSTLSSAGNKEALGRHFQTVTILFPNNFYPVILACIDESCQNHLFHWRLQYVHFLILQTGLALLDAIPSKPGSRLPNAPQVTLMAGGKRVSRPLQLAPAPVLSLTGCGPKGGPRSSNICSPGRFLEMQASEWESAFQQGPQGICVLENVW